MIRVILRGKHRNEGREFIDSKEFVTEIGDLEKATSFKFIKKGAKTIEAEKREQSIIYNMLQSLFESGV